MHGRRERPGRPIDRGRARPPARAAWALALLALATAWTPAAGQKTIFRYVDLGGARIRLGETVPAFVRVDPDGARRYRLRGTYTGADTIDVVLTPAGTVHAAEFVYARGTNFDEMVRGYEDDLGPAQRTDASLGRSAEWRDGRTTFRVLELDGRVRSQLVDDGDGGDLRDPPRRIESGSR